MNKLPEVFELYLYNFEHAFSKDAKTVKSYRDVLNNFNKYIFNSSIETSIEDIKTLEADDILLKFLKVYQVEGNKGKGVKNSTLNKNIAAIRSFYDWASDRYLIKNVAKRIPLFKNDSKSKDILQLDDCQKLINNVKRKMLEDPNLTTTRVHLIISLLLGTGVRIEELSYIRISLINKSERYIHLEKTKFGKERTISIPQQLVSEIESYLEFRLLENEKLQEDVQDFLFTSRKYNRLSPEQIRVLVYKEYEELGFKNIDVHSLRKSFTTNMIDAGCPVHEVSKMLGHKNINTTLNIYNKPDLKDTSEFNILFNNEVKETKHKITKEENSNVIQISFNAI